MDQLPIAPHEVYDARNLALPAVSEELVALAYQGITYTTKEDVVDLGPFKVETKREKTIPLPPIVGVAALVGGIVLVVVSARK